MPVKFLTVPAIGNLRGEEQLSKIREYSHLPDVSNYGDRHAHARPPDAAKASHLSLISHPEEITQLTLEAAGQDA
jgi:hypothetical protein